MKFSPEKRQPLALFIFWFGFRGRFGAWNIAGHVLELDQPLGLALGGIEVDAGRAHRRARVHIRQLADHRIGCVDAGLRFCGARLGPATQPFDLGLYAVAQALLLAALRFEISLLFFKKAAEVALHAQQAVGKDAIQFDDLAGSGFEKVAVVADGDGGEGR